MKYNGGTMFWTDLNSVSNGIIQTLAQSTNVIEEAKLKSCYNPEDCISRYSTIKAEMIGANKNQIIVAKKSINHDDSKFYILKNQLWA